MWCGIRVRLPPPWPRSESWDTFLLVLVKVELRQPRRKERSGKEREVVLWGAPGSCFLQGTRGTRSLQEVLDTSTDPQTFRWFDYQALL